jgi:TolB protein
VTSKAISRLTFDPGIERSPVFSPEGTQIAYAAQRSDGASLRMASPNRTFADELLLEGDFVPSSWSVDGFIAYTDSSSARSPDVWVLPMLGDRKPFPVLQTADTEGSAMFSPNGRWIAYTSNTLGRTDVYVQSFPKPGGTRITCRPTAGVAQCGGTMERSCSTAAVT